MSCVLKTSPATDELIICCVENKYVLVQTSRWKSTTWPHTFQVINRFFQFGHCPLCELCTGFSLTGIETQYVRSYLTNSRQ